ncbi:MAG: hypothetical protein ACM3PP_02355 [Candidatus Saccharibacteria bacterium]
MKAKKDDLEYTQPLLTKHEPLLNLTGKSMEKITDKMSEKDYVADKDPLADKFDEGAQI